MVVLAVVAVGFVVVFVLTSMLGKKTAFLICPVRMFMKPDDELADGEREEMAAIVDYNAKLERNGYKAYWPYRDTNQEDPVGLRICTDNLRAIKKCDEVHVWWNKDSMGSHFDFGMAFALKKKIILANPSLVERTGEKSFSNVLLSFADMEVED